MSYFKQVVETLPHYEKDAILHVHVHVSCTTSVAS